MTKETILKRLLLENHITVEELIILGMKDIYETRDPQSFPPNFGEDLYINVTEWDKYSPNRYWWQQPQFNGTINTIPESKL